MKAVGKLLAAGATVGIMVPAKSTAPPAEREKGGKPIATVGTLPREATPAQRAAFHKLKMQNKRSRRAGEIGHYGAQLAAGHSIPANLSANHPDATAPLDIHLQRREARAKT